MRHASRGRTRGSGGTRAFTLLEVLVAVGLLAMVSLLMYEAIRLTFRAREEIGRVEELSHSAQVALRRLSSDISMAYLSNHVNPNNPTTTTLFVGKGDSLLFSYMGHERRRRGSRESDQGVVEYRLERDRDGSRSLMRREKSTPDTEPGSGGVKETLVSGIKEFRLLYWDAKGEDWKDDWRAEMEDAGRSGIAGSLDPRLAPAGSALMKAEQDRMLEEFQLPSRVYVRMVLEDVAGNEFPFETQARVHLRFPLNF
jgi:general secretion pathway protein J